MKKTLTLSAIITSVILLSGISGFVLSSPDAFALHDLSFRDNLTDQEILEVELFCEAACYAAIDVMTADAAEDPFLSLFCPGPLCDSFAADRSTDCDDHLPEFRISGNVFGIGLNESGEYDFSYQACVDNFVFEEPEGKNNPCDALDKASEKGSDKGKDKKAKGIEKAKKNNDC